MSALANILIPPKLKPGAHVRVITPSRSFSMIPREQREISMSRMAELGLHVSFGKHVEEADQFASSPVESRIADLHDAFNDSSVNGILTVIGGWNINQILSRVDFDQIRRNPKVLCGYSDITALQNAMLAKAGVMTYSGPHFSTFAMKQRFDFTMEHFRKCLFRSEPFELRASEFWSNDEWFLDQNKRDFMPNPGYTVLNEGSASGVIVGGNLGTFCLLKGTPFMPSLDGTVLFLEECDHPDSMAVEFDRLLQSIIHQPDFCGVQALVIGRFEKAAKVTVDTLRAIIGGKPELRRMPVICGADFGHTDPYITFPIGGQARVSASGGQATIEITTH